MGECLLCGWTEKQFWLSSFRAVYNLIRTHRKAEERRSREAWEQTRMICDFVLAPHRKKGSTGRSFELPWDGEAKSEADVLTPEQIREVQERFARLDQKIKKRFQNGTE